MRLSYFLIPLSISFSVFAQNCDHTSFPLNGGTVNCATLRVDSQVVLNRSYGVGSSAITFIVTGDVEINADINLNGKDGVRITTDTEDGGAGGPGAGDGGGIALTSELGGSDGPPYSGAASSNDGTCNHGGGGGGGVSSAGETGENCPDGTFSTPGVGGLKLTAAEFNFPAPFRGGFGGGAGGAKPLGGSVFDAGAGGGGGGAIRIRSTTGRITIKNGVAISARGGNGGNSIDIGGGGGGGSGGAIWLEAPVGGIINRGILDVRGGTGGTKLNGTKGNGGRGGDGVFRINNANVITEGTGISYPARTKLNSSIACGTINEEENNNFIFSMALSFLIVFFLKSLFPVRRKIS